MDVGRFSEIWVADFEFQSAAGECPVPICMVARELRSGRTLRLWGDEMVPTVCPYSTGPDALFVAYYASAEMGCHLALEWSFPSNVLDLYAEFRVETNGKVLPFGNGLLGALEYYGHNGISTLEKDEMRNLVLRGGPYSADERRAILDYCESDVTATCTLLQSMLAVVSPMPRFGQALLRGRYTKAVAYMESHGIPMDGELLRSLQENWVNIQDELIAKVDAHFGIYEGRTFKLARFAEYLQRNGIAWPRLESGRLALDDDTFGEQCKIHPELRPLKELRHALGQMRLNDLAVGKDDRNRTMLSMFRSKTGRNQPSTTRFVFGLPAWLRGLIEPDIGHALVYVDWSQQEFGIAAALSGDRHMQEAYHSGDPYLAFAKQAGAVPLGATKASHAAEREQFKACVLAVQYGMQEDSLARRIQQPTVYARELLRKHRQTYKRFWEWSDGVLDYALTNRRLWTTFGWVLHVTGSPNTRSLRNFPMQANGAEMLRIACCLATEQGLRVIAPIHDAVLIEAPVDMVDSMTSRMQECMRRASSIVLDGFELRADAKTVYPPERYNDERGAVMWNTVQELLSNRESNRPQVGVTC